METRNILNLSFTLLLTACLVLEMIARVVFLGTSLVTATISLLIVAGITVSCLWYASIPRTTPLTGLALLCRVVVATQVMLSAKELISTQSLPLYFCWAYALSCLALSVASAFTLERDLRVLLAQNREK